MNLSLDGIPETPCSFPDLAELDPAKKKKSYITQFGRGFLTQYGQSGRDDFYKGRARYAQLEAYANGDNLVPSIFKKDETQSAEAEKTAIIDFRPLPFLHKPLISIEGLLKDHSYEATVTPVDPTSLDERLDYESRMRAWMEHQEFLASLGQAQPGGPGADIPMDSDDLDLHMEVSYKIRDAIDLEQKITFGFYLSDYGRQDQQCTRDETVKGVSVLFMARRGPRRLPVRLSPGDCFILPAAAEDFPNLQAGAHIERLSLGQVLAEISEDTETTLSDNQIQRLKSLAQERQFGGPNVGANYFLDSALGSEPELAGEVQVIRFAFLSTDLEVQKELIDGRGNRQIFPKKPSYVGPVESKPETAQASKVHRKTIQNWYEGTLIPGSDISFGCRLAYEQLRSEDNPFTCLPLYIVNAPGMMGGRIKSMVERCMPIVDTASRAYVKMNHTMAKWPDIYVKFNRDALLETVTNTSEGVKTAPATVREQIKFFIEEGITVGDEYDADGNQLGPAVQVQATPIAAAVAYQFNVIQNCKAELADITGITAAVSGGELPDRAGEGVTKLSIDGSQNALNHLFVAKHSRFERAARAIAASVKSGEDESRRNGPAPLAGPLRIDTRAGQKAVYVKPSPGIAKRSWQIKIEQKPTEQQWTAFYAYMTNFTQGPDPILSPKDVADLYMADNLKLARYLLAIRYKRKMAERQQQASAASEDQGKQAAMAAEAKGKEDRATDDYKTENKLKIIQAQNDGGLAIAKEQTRSHLLATNMSQAAKMEALEVEKQAAAEADSLREQAAHERHAATLDSQENRQLEAQQHEADMVANAPQPATAA